MGCSKSKCFRGARRLAAQWLPARSGGTSIETPRGLSSRRPARLRAAVGGRTRGSRPTGRTEPERRADDVGANPHADPERSGQGRLRPDRARPGARRQRARAVGRLRVVPPLAAPAGRSQHHADHAIHDVSAHARELSADRQTARRRPVDRGRGDYRGARANRRSRYHATRRRAGRQAGARARQSVSGR